MSGLLCFEMLGSQCASHGGQILVYYGSLQNYLMLVSLCKSAAKEKNSYENILIILAISILHAMSNLLKHVLDHLGMTEVVVLILNLEMEYV